MTIAFKTWGQKTSGSVPVGMPLEVPWQMSVITEEEIPRYKAMGFKIMTDEEYEAYGVEISPAVDAYLAAKDELETIAYVKGAVEQAVEFGKNMINDYGVKNTLRGYSSEDVAVVAQALSPISMLLQSGALYTALGAIQALPTTSLITDEDKTEFMVKIMDYLGLEG